MSAIVVTTLADSAAGPRLSLRAAGDQGPTGRDGGAGGDGNLTAGNGGAGPTGGL